MQWMSRWPLKIPRHKSNAEDQNDSKLESLLAEAAFLMNHASEFILDEDEDTVQCPTAELALA